MTKRKRKHTPITVRDMAYRRGLAVLKARRGGWYIMLGMMVIYATHDWDRVETFVKKYPILIKRSGE